MGNRRRTYSKQDVARIREALRLLPELRAPTLRSDRRVSLQEERLILGDAVHALRARGYSFDAILYALMGEQEVPDAFLREYIACVRPRRPSNARQRKGRMRLPDMPDRAAQRRVDRQQTLLAQDSNAGAGS